MIKNNNLPKVTIVGRTNTGKSTLFNCLVEEKRALTSTIPGTTRDINYGICSWRGKKIILEDTAGLDIKPQNTIEEKAVEKTKNTIKKSDLILFTVDIKTGLLPQDKELALFVKKLKKPIILACNKADSPKLRERGAEFYKLGLGEPLFVSAANGSGTGDLLDEIVKQLRKNKLFKRGRTKEEKEALKIAIIGKPNVGKSSLANSILGEERVIVSDIPHTTREPQDIVVEYKNQNFILIDTAGIRRKSKSKPGLEKLGISQSFKSLKKADIAVLVTEAQKLLTSQDSRLAGLLIESKKGIIIAANKWDLVEEKTTKTQNEFKKYFYKHFPYLTWAPLVFVSSKTGQRVKNILDLALEIKEQQEKEITDRTLERFLKTIVKKHKPSRRRGIKHPYIYELKQTGIKPPQFTLVVNDKDNVHFSYLRFIENRLREKFGFEGTAIELKLKQRKK